MNKSNKKYLPKSEIFSLNNISISNNKENLEFKYPKYNNKIDKIMQLTDKSKYDCFRLLKKYNNNLNLVVKTISENQQNLDEFKVELQVQQDTTPIIKPDIEESKNIFSYDDFLLFLKSPIQNIKLTDSFNKIFIIIQKKALKLKIPIEKVFYNEVLSKTKSLKKKKAFIEQFKIKYIKLNIHNLNFITFCKQLESIKYNESLHILKRNTIHDLVIKKLNITKNSKGIYSNEEFINKIKLFGDQKFFEYLLELYDIHFFEKKWQKLAKENKNICLNICWNKRCYKVIGRCFAPKNGQIKIELAELAFDLKKIKRHKKKDKIFMKKYLESLEKGEKINIDGLIINTHLKLLMTTFEHELIHATLSVFCKHLEYSNMNSIGTWKGNTNHKDGHSKTFMSILNNIFGHTSYKVHAEILNEDTLKKKKWALHLYNTLQEKFEIYYTGLPGNLTHKAIITKTGGRLKKKLKAKILFQDTIKNMTIPYLLIDSYKNDKGKLIEYSTFSY